MAMEVISWAIKMEMVSLVEMRVWSPGQEDFLEKEMATHASIAA